MLIYIVYSIYYIYTHVSNVFRSDVYFAVSYFQKKGTVWERYVNVKYITYFINLHSNRFKK